MPSPEALTVVLPGSTLGVGYAEEPGAAPAEVPPEPAEAPPEPAPDPARASAGSASAPVPAARSVAR